MYSPFIFTFFFLVIAIGDILCIPFGLVLGILESNLLLMLMDMHLSQYLIIIDKAAMSIFLHVCQWLYASFLFDIFLGVGLLADRIGICSVVGITKQFKSGWIDSPYHQQCMRGFSPEKPVHCSTLIPSKILIPRGNHF